MRPREGCEATGPITDCGVGGRHQAHGLIDAQETALRRGHRPRAVEMGADERGRREDVVLKTGREAAERACGFLGKSLYGRVKPHCPGPFGGQVPHAGGGSQWGGFWRTASKASPVAVWLEK